MAEKTEKLVRVDFTGMGWLRDALEAAGYDLEKVDVDISSVGQAGVDVFLNGKTRYAYVQVDWDGDVVEFENSPHTMDGD